MCACSFLHCARSIGTLLIENASATAQFATQLPNEQVEGGGGDLPNAPATDSDSLSGLQWDMRQIHTPEAHAVTGGSPAVLVGDIDTGLDYRHPDLRQNVDSLNSVNCVSGTPVPGAAAANDDNIRFTIPVDRLGSLR